MYLYSYVQHGKVFIIENLNLIYLKDLVVLLSHVYPLIIFLLNLIILY